MNMNAAQIRTRALKKTETSFLAMTIMVYPRMKILLMVPILDSDCLANALMAILKVAHGWAYLD